MNRMRDQSILFQLTQGLQKMKLTRYLHPRKRHRKLVPTRAHRPCRKESQERHAKRLVELRMFHLGPQAQHRDADGTPLEGQPARTEFLSPRWKPSTGAVRQRTTCSIVAGRAPEAHHRQLRWGRLASWTHLLTGRHGEQN